MDSKDNSSPKLLTADDLVVGKLYCLANSLKLTVWDADNREAVGIDVLNSFTPFMLVERQFHDIVGSTRRAALQVLYSRAGWLQLYSHNLFFLDAKETVNDNRSGF